MHPHASPSSQVTGFEFTLSTRYRTVWPQYSWIASVEFKIVFVFKVACTRILALLYHMSWYGTAALKAANLTYKIFTFMRFLVVDNDQSRLHATDKI